MTFYKVIIFSVSILFASLQVYSNTVKITVKETDKTPLIGATVQLSNVDNNSTVFKVTDNNGLAVFDNIKTGLYSLKITYVGFMPVEKSLNIRPGAGSFEYLMEAASLNLDEVTITARKPLIRQEDDKMIIDPEPLASISTNTLEILENTPGLYVDQDGGIFLTSTTPAAVYINGREQKMSNQDITTILRSLPPNSVERIEVLRTPSTKYDAASSGGIVNIILKKGVKIGRFGSASLGMNQGVYGNRFAGFSYNDSGEKSTMYANLNYNYNDMLEELNSVRILNPQSTLDQAADTRRINNQLFFGYGINYDVKPSINLAYDGRVNASLRNSSSNNMNIIFGIEDAILSESENITNNFSEFLSIQQDLGMIVKLDTIGSDWDTKFSYNYSGNTGFQDYNTEYFQPFSLSNSGEGDNNQGRHFMVFQSDLTYHLPLEFKLETGIKSAFQNYDSKADFFIHQNNSLIEDTVRTNSFYYDESINAAYIQASRNIGLGFNLKAGVRLEHTFMEGNQTIPSDTSFVVNRADWFPYVYLSRELIDIMGIKLFGYVIYRKTINRPGYQDLNPYIRFVDQFLYETGNPALTPQFTENIEVNISFNDMPVFAVGQNKTKDIFSSVMYQDENQDGVLIRTLDNLGKNKETYFRGILGIPPGGKYFFAVGGQYNYLEYDGIYNNEPLTFTNGSWRLFTFHSLRLFKETRLTMNGFMMTNGQWNFYELKTFGMLNFGLSQTFLNKKLTVTLSARDVLRTMVNEFEFNQGGVSSYGSRYTDNMRFGINIRYNFGIRQREEKKSPLPQMEMEM
ncbi:MAG: outer membrane beta-barrel protein [Bacteroidetes bacterium]|nr:outer membrane beta-barrel protein [Bacteroidota bacterium]